MVAQGILLDFIYIFENMVVIWGIFCVPVAKKKRFIIYGWIVLIGLFVGDAWLGYDNFWVLTLRVYLAPVIMLMWTSGKLARRLMIFICSVMYLHLPYLCIDFFFSWTFGKYLGLLGESLTYQIIRGVLVIVATGVLAYKLQKIPSFKNVLQYLPTKYYIIGTICCFAASMVQYYIEDVRDMLCGNLDQMIFITSCMVIVSLMFYALGVGVAVLDILRKKYQKESHLKDEYLEITREYVRMIKESAKETRRMRHDFQAHVGSLWHYMEEEKYEKARLYLSDLRSHTDKIFKKTLSVNHEIVDAVLLEAQIRSERLQVQWSVEGHIPPELSMTDFDLCTIFSNILANSLEACEKLLPEQRTIDLEIRSYSNYVLIELENPTECSVETEKLGNITSKPDIENHGYGIINVRTVTERNGGQISFENKDGKFCVRILLPFEI